MVLQSIYIIIIVIATKVYNAIGQFSNISFISHAENFA